ncbi:uncharacterized protein TNCT_499211 [Trichonephila clavata]|uniref:Uncharacterized protein n=1 Tax=Trichonephila clavata TaxID=2740835 RepID=A0A8X6M4Z4_TRICU|nr:uncharacterized protein TNCT_499211 [Trichonephila clavata]
MISNFINNYKEESNFVNYFVYNYANRAEKWAYCYRNVLGINTNMKLERKNRQLKYEEAGGTVMKRLDKTISLLLAAIAKKSLSRVISIERGKLTSRVALIRKRHKLSEEMGDKYDSVVADEKHIVTKSEGSSIFLEGNRTSKEELNEFCFRRLATNTA